MASKRTLAIFGVGAADGLGAALARRFAVEAFTVFLIGRTQAKLDQIAEDIRRNGGMAVPFVADSADPYEVAEAIAAADGDGALEAVIANVGSNAPIAFADLSPETFESFWRTCCFSGFLAAKACLPRFEGRGRGALFFTGASASLRGRPNFAHFAAAKAGLRALAQALAREYGPKGVHVAHVIIDGVINGARVRDRFPGYIESLGQDGALNPDAIADVYWSLYRQPRSAWTHELDLRPFGEKW